MCCINKREEIDTHHFRSMSLLKAYEGESNQNGSDEDDGRWEVCWLEMEEGGRGVNSKELREEK